MPGILPGMPSPTLSQTDKAIAARRAVDLVVIHCSATPSGKPLRQGTPGTPGYKNCVQVIDAWHAERGFRRDPEAVKALSTGLSSIGYHYVIDLTGEVWTGRGLAEVGAHVANFNAQSVGICLVGGAERDGRYTPEQWNSLRQVVAMLLTTYGLPRAAPLRAADPTSKTGFSVRSGVCGHRDLSPDLNKDGRVQPTEWLKTCPGFDVAAWLANGMQPLPQHIFQEISA